MARKYFGTVNRPRKNPLSETCRYLFCNGVQQIWTNSEGGKPKTAPCALKSEAAQAFQFLADCLRAILRPCETLPEARLNRSYRPPQQLNGNCSPTAGRVPRPSAKGKRAVSFV